MTDEPNPYESPRTNCETGLPPAAADGSHRFRFTFCSLWLFAMVVAALLTSFMVALPVLFIVKRPLTEMGVAIVLSLIVVMIAETVGAMLIWYCSSVHVSTLGIRCQNGLGRYRSVEWKDVTRVKLTRFLGIPPYFRLYTKDGHWPLWLPSFMAKPKIFWPYLLSQLDPASPLAKAIREAGLAE